MGGGGGLNLLPNFQKGGGLDGPLVFRGGWGGKGGGGGGGGGWESGGVTFLRKGCNFYIKNKLKSEISNDKKGL